MILIAPDKFKGSLTAQQVCEAIAEGLLDVDPSLTIVSFPFADGGEGTAKLLCDVTGGIMRRVNVLDPLFRSIESGYGLSGDGSTAFIEMASASGLQLLKKEERNPLIATTFGTGQLIADALDRNVKKIIVGVGGSATTDAGMGMAEALGFRFYSSKNEKLNPIGRNLGQVAIINDVNAHPRLRDCEFTTIFDVANPLYGKHGAAYVFSGQKGATAADIEFLDRGLAHFAQIVLGQFNMNINFAGAGAGGGLAALAKLVLKSHFQPGIDFIIGFTKLEEQIRDASIVITGEGKIDEQTLSGKVVQGVAQLCTKHNKKCIAFAGRCDLPENRLSMLGLADVIALTGTGVSEENAMRNAYVLLKEKTIQYFRH